MKQLIFFLLLGAATAAAAQTPQYVPLNAPVLNNICIAVNQKTGAAGTDIQACINALPAAPTSCNLAGGGIVDATGYNTAQTIAGLNFNGKPVILNLGSATYDVTGIINATNIKCGVSIIGDGARLLGDTGAGKPVIDLVGTSKDFLKGFRISTGQTGGIQSTIGILEARSAANPFNWWHHFEDVQIMMQSDLSANGGHGVIGIYNYGAEVAHYENITVSTDLPIVGTRSNLFSIPAPDVAFYTGLTTMNAVQIDGKSDFYTTTSSYLTLDGAQEWDVDVGEASGNMLIGVPAIYITGNTNDLRLLGEIEHFTRVLTLNNGAMFQDQIGGTCSDCQNTAFSGNVSYTNASTSAAPASMTNLAVGQMVTSTAVPYGTYITAVGVSTITLSSAATASGSVATTTAEPVMMLDSRSCSVACNDFSGTSFTTGSYGGQYAYYLLNVGGEQSGSAGWSVYLSEGGSLGLASNNGDSMTGTISIPHEEGLSAPVISAGITGIVLNNGSVAILGGPGTSTFGAITVPGVANLTTAAINSLTTVGPINLQQTTASGQYFLNVPAGNWGIVRATGNAGIAVGTSNQAAVLIDPLGNQTVPGNLNVGLNISAGGGSSIVYRCTTAGATLPIGSLTITAAACGASADTGLRVK